MSRRVLIGGALTIPFAAEAARPGSVKALNWESVVRVSANGKPLAIHTKTRVEPFVRARSETYLVDQGPASMRVLVIEPDGGWVERDGQSTALPPSQARHERQQYGIYGYMLEALAEPAQGTHLKARHDGYPLFEYASNGDLPTMALYTVSTPDGQGTIRELFRFEGRLTGTAIPWPKRITIEQDGQGGESALTITFDSLTAEFA